MRNTKKTFLERKNVIISFRRYGIDAMSAMALGLFASLLIGTIINTIGQNVAPGSMISRDFWRSAAMPLPSPVL